jgi:hypothetical protein
MRNYAMTYVRTMLPALADLFGDEEARRLGGITGRLIGMQYYARTAEPLGVQGASLEAFADYLAQLGAAQGDDATWTCDGDAVVVRQRSWRLMDGTDAVSPAVFDAWNELWVGALSIHDRRARLQVAQRPGADGSAITWRLARGRPA